MSKRGDGEKMTNDLESTITKVNSYGNGNRIIEFENGHAITYERQNPNYGQVCTLIPWDNRLKPKIKAGGSVCLHSKEFHALLKDYSSPLQKETAKLDGRIQDIYKEMTSVLNVKRNTHWKPHEGILGVVALTAYAGVMMLGAAYTFVSNKYVRSAFLEARANRQREPLTDLLIETAKSIAFPFIAIGYAICYNEKSYSISNKKPLNTGVRGVDPAINICGQTGETFDDLELIFPDGLKIRKEWGNGNWEKLVSEQYKKLHSREDENCDIYEKSTQFIKIDESLKSELYSLVEKKEQVEKSWRSFEKQIRGKEIEFLKKKGFTED